MKNFEEEAELRREIERARDGAVESIVNLTANLIRMVRGGGEHYQLSEQLLSAADAFRRHWDLSKTWPYHEVEKAILREGPGGDDERACAEEEIILGALQVAASELLTQRTQRTRGHRQMMGGVRERRSVVALPPR